MKIKKRNLLGTEPAGYAGETTEIFTTENICVEASCKRPVRFPDEQLCIVHALIADGRVDAKEAAND